ncbi:MAG TPA: hypothetical protein VE664_04825 [Actinomycetes bacterium]|nr:hypothetical protein [Actinomycetes bacterium]
MAITAAALVPHPPLLVPELGRGASPDLDQLRSACLRAVSTTLDRVDALLVAGPAPMWGEAAPGATGSFAPYGAAVTTHLPAPFEGAQGRAGGTQGRAGGAQGGRGDGAQGRAGGTQGRAGGGRDTTPAGDLLRGGASATSGGDWLDRRDLPPGRLTELPLSLAVAAWLLDQAGARGLPRLAAFGVPASMRVEQAAATGRTLAGAVRAGLHVGLLVMGDLSARRTARAPATFHPAAEEFDRQIAAAIRKADIRHILDADTGLAAELRVGGMAVLWLLAGALEEVGELRTEVLYEAAPFGVGYLVGVIESR